MNTADQLKRIKELLGAVTGFEDDDQQYVDDARDAVQKLIEALAEQPAQPQQEPLQNNPFDCGVYLGSGKDYAIKHHVSYGPAQQEPVAWTNWRELVGARHYRTPGWEMYADKRNPDDVAIYISPPAQRTWVGLTDEQIDRLWSQSLADTEGETWLPLREFARAIEAAHGIKENT